MAGTAPPAFKEIGPYSFEVSIDHRLLQLSLPGHFIFIVEYLPFKLLCNNMSCHLLGLFYILSR